MAKHIDLAKLNYPGGDCPFYSSDIEADLAAIYAPLPIDDISNMDNSSSYEFLVALDNLGYRVGQIDLGGGVNMETLDPAIETRDLYYLYVAVSTVKPLYMCSVWRYKKQSMDLDVYTEEPNDSGFLVFSRLEELERHRNLERITEEDALHLTTEDGKTLSVYDRYFDFYALGE